MPGRPQLIPSIRLETSLPADIYARVQGELFSPAEGKVPKGAWQRFLIQCILEHYNQPQKETESV